MFCTQCGKESDATKKFCTSCGSPLIRNENYDNRRVEVPVKTSLPKSSSFGIRSIITILVILGFIGFGIYNALDEEAITANNDALTNFESGNSQQAAQQLDEASKNAISNETKINTLKNLGYVHSTEGNNDQALTAFIEALGYTTQDTFDYYLVSGEIALLEGKPNAANISFYKAYGINPEDYQINNSLALFHIDVEDIAPQYVDYPKAVTFAQKAYSLNSGEIARQNLGIAYYFNENYDQAISTLSQTNIDQHPYIALWLGLSYAGKKDIVNAKLYIQKATDAGVEVPPEVREVVNSI